MIILPVTKAFACSCKYLSYVIVPYCALSNDSFLNVLNDGTKLLVSVFLDHIRLVLILITTFQSMARHPSLGGTYLIDKIAQDD
jgi:hypothetical protein